MNRYKYCLKKKLIIFRKYLNKNLKKEYIQKFQLSTKYSILFVSKSNKKFRLCVDYKKLNDITIKNKYSLLNINELQNKLNKIKIFINMNLKNKYHLIKTKKKTKNEKQYFVSNTIITNIKSCYLN